MKGYCWRIVLALQNHKKSAVSRSKMTQNLFVSSQISACLEFASSTISWVFVIKSATCFSHDSNGCMYDEFSLIHHFNSSDDDFIAYAVSKSALLVTKNHFHVIRSQQANQTMLGIYVPARRWKVQTEDRSYHVPMPLFFAGRGTSYHMFAVKKQPALSGPMELGMSKEPSNEHAQLYHAPKEAQGDLRYNLVT